jgi:ABC-type multidrug transport system ATPase subunit
VGSGGEQAVLVHLPLFAAAAALYDGAPAAPRLVMLDEALSGIDDDARARVMGSLVDLDRDFMMTSHELWRTYRTVPSLAI